MERSIGKTGVRVKAIGFGGMPISIDGRPSEKDSLKVIHAALDAGTNFIDTANVYCLNDDDIGHNEALIKKALDSWTGSNPVWVATKGGLERPGGSWTVNGAPEFLRQSCEQSLKALGTESIFLYQLHAVDDDVPLAESVGELARLQTEGKIKHIGLSNVDLEEIQDMEKVCQIESVQNRCNPFCKRDFTSGLIDYCGTQGITYLPYSPVGGGGGHKRLANFGLFKELAGKYSCSPYVVALAWLLQTGDHILPIPAARRVEGAVDSPRALNVKLAADDLQKIMEIKE